MSTQLVQNRLNDLNLLPAQMTAFTRMGVEAGDQNVGGVQAEMFFQVLIQDTQHTGQFFRCDSIRHGTQGEVGCGQCHP